MSKELVAISPEGMEIANNYLQFGNIQAVSEMMNVPKHTVVETLNTREVKKYLDTVYLDLGYRNRDNIASLMDTMIASKLEEAEESGVYTSKDLLELLQIAHKMRMDEIKAQGDSAKDNIRNQTNVQINDGSGFGEGNYGQLMEKLLKQG
jgi:hypothetical protein